MIDVSSVEMLRTFGEVGMCMFVKVCVFVSFLLRAA